MDVSEFVGSYIKVELPNNFFFKGKLISEDEDSIIILDSNNRKNSIKKNQILFIREVLR